MSTSSQRRSLEIVSTETYSRIGLCKLYRNLQSYWTLQTIPKLTVVLVYENLRDQNQQLPVSQSRSCSTWLNVFDVHLKPCKTRPKESMPHLLLMEKKLKNNCEMQLPDLTNTLFADYCVFRNGLKDPYECVN